MNFRPRWRRREIMGFGEPWRVIHSLPCTNSPVIHPQAPRPPLPVCLPHSARLTFLPPKCIYISPPSSGSTWPHTWYHVQKGGSGMKSKGETLPASHQPLIQTPPPSSGGSVGPWFSPSSWLTDLSEGDDTLPRIDLLTWGRCHAQLVNIRGEIVTLNPGNFSPVWGKPVAARVSAVLWSNYSSGNNLLTPVSNEHTQTITLHTRAFNDCLYEWGADKNKAGAVCRHKEGYSKTRAVWHDTFQLSLFDFLPTVII